MGDPAGLPREIGRPLWVGATALFVFLLCAVIWSVTAPLSTSIHVSGTLISSRPDFEIQHAVGGQISWVGIRPQQEVTKGQPLLRLDVSLEAKTLTETKLQISSLNQEIAAIDAALKNKLNEPHSGSKQTGVRDRFRAEHQAFQLRAETLKGRALAIDVQVSAGERELSIVGQRLKLLRDLEARQIALFENALIREADVNRLANQILELAGQKEKRRGELAALRHQAAQSIADAQGLTADYRAGLIKRLHENQIRLSDLRKEQAKLESVVAAAELVSPIDGHVHRLNFDSSHMFAPKGQTLVVLAQRLESPRVRLTIPTSAIDQIQPGMKGRLTIASLPQRDVPPIDVVLSAISPLAEKDSDGAPLGFIAEAALDAASFAHAATILQDRLRLSADMPISVVLTGRKTTLAEYLFAPAASAFANAFQD